MIHWPDKVEHARNEGGVVMGGKGVVTFAEGSGVHKFVGSIPAMGLPVMLRTLSMPAYQKQLDLSIRSCNTYMYTQSRMLYVYIWM